MRNLEDEVLFDGVCVVGESFEEGERVGEGGGICIGGDCGKGGGVCEGKGLGKEDLGDRVEGRDRRGWRDRVGDASGKAGPVVVDSAEVRVKVGSAHAGEDSGDNCGEMRVWLWRWLLFVWVVEDGGDGWGGSVDGDRGNEGRAVEAVGDAGPWLGQHEVERRRVEAEADVGGPRDALCAVPGEMMRLVVAHGGVTVTRDDMLHTYAAQHAHRVDATPALWICAPLADDAPLSADVECLRWQAYLALRRVPVHLRTDIDPAGALDQRLPNLHADAASLLPAHSIPQWADQHAPPEPDYRDQAARDESHAWTALLHNAVQPALLLTAPRDSFLSLRPPPAASLPALLTPPPPPLTGLVSLFPPLGARISSDSIYASSAEAIAAISDRLATDTWFLASLCVVPLPLHPCSPPTASQRPSTPSSLPISTPSSSPKTLLFAPKSPLAPTSSRGNAVSASKSVLHSSNLLYIVLVTCPVPIPRPIPIRKSPPFSILFLSLVKPPSQCTDHLGEPADISTSIPQSVHTHQSQLRPVSTRFPTPNTIMYIHGISCRTSINVRMKSNDCISVSMSRARSWCTYHFASIHEPHPKERREQKDSIDKLRSGARPTRLVHEPVPT